MKNSLIACGAVLLGINAASVYFPGQNLTLAAQTTSAAIGMVLVFLAIRPQSRQMPEKSSPTKPVPPPPRAEAEIVAMLALLQEHGRLIDFAKEDITGASDAQIGSAARVVHAGCRKVFDEYFEISPLQSVPEGSLLTLEQGYDAPAFRLVGSVPENPPYRGKLLHPGWITQSVKLPRVTGTTDKRPWPILAPAEVELGGN